MANFSFEETLKFFSEKLHATPSAPDLEKKEVELVIDTLHVVIAQGKLAGSLHMSIVLGLLVQPIKEARLKDLATSNFLGINTGGCTLAFDEMGVSLCLHGATTGGASPQENWEWLHRLVSVAREWNKVLTLWDEFVPMSTTDERNDNAL